jgi:hypothetical protein
MEQVLPGALAIAVLLDFIEVCVLRIHIRLTGQRMMPTDSFGMDQGEIDRNLPN